MNLNPYLLPNLKAILMDKDVNYVDNMMITQFPPIKKEYWVQSGVQQYLENIENQSEHLVQTVVRFPHQEDDTKFVCLFEYTKMYMPDIGFDNFNKGTDNATQIYALNPYDFTFGVGIWPNFKADGWKYYQLSVDITKIGNSESIKHLTGLFDSTDVKLKIYAEDLEKFIEFDVNSVPRRIEFVPTVIELLIGNTIIGTRYIKLQKLIDSNISATSLGLDFGTSNTCMAVTIDNNPENLNLANTKKEPRLEWLIHSNLGDEYDKNRWLWNRSGYYLQRQAEVSETHCYTIPSELLLGLSTVINRDTTKQETFQLELLRNQAEEVVRVGGVDVEDPIFSPLCSDYIGCNANDKERIALFNILLSSDNPQRIYNDFKWLKKEVSTLNTIIKLRHVYIEQVLIGVLARLRQRSFCQFDYMYITQPDALPIEYLPYLTDDYAEEINEILRNLQKITGIKFIRDNALEVSQTAVALRNAHVNSKESYIVIDIGGNTTDCHVCLNYFDNNGEMRSHDYSSSIQWAGNDLLKALTCSHNQLTAIMANYRIKSSNDNIYKLLSFYISNDINIMHNIANPEPIVSAVRMFFESIYEYIFVKIKLLMQSLNIELNQLYHKNVNILLQGNGFRIADYFNIPELINIDGFSRVWNEVFHECDVNSINLNLTYDKENKENSIQAGAYVADKILNDKIKSDEYQFKQMVLYPPKILDINTTDKPVVARYQPENSEIIVNIADAYKGNGQLINELERLFPYTKRYWSNAFDVASLFASQKGGNIRFMDIGEMYLIGSGSNQSDWSFSKDISTIAGSDFT